MLNRRSLLLASLLPAVSGLVSARSAPLEGAATRTAAGNSLALCMHQTTMARAGFQATLEGCSRAGVMHVELTAKSLDEFLKNNTLAAAHRLLNDLGLKAVSCTPGAAEVWHAHPGRAAALEVWTRRCEQFAELGLKSMYASSNTKQKMTPDDYRAGPACMREAAEIAQRFGMTAMVEFSRSSTYISTLPTALQLIRAADHPRLKPVLDFYHFFTGMSRMEDLDLLHDGELGHVHFQDVPDMPRELLDGFTRAIPGDGIAPLHQALKKILQKGYTGALSVELYLPELQQGDPYEVAQRVRTSALPVIVSAAASLR